jgi:hypothetical protein
MLKDYQARITSLEDIVHHRGPERAKVPPEEDLYRRLQQTVPPNQPMLVMLEHTFYLDGRRNPFHHYDHPGAMGPRGGPPSFQGPEAFADYMQALGIRYVTYQLGHESYEYSRPPWQSRFDTPENPNGRGGFYKNQARFELDFFDTITALSQTRKVLFQEGDLKVLDLETRSH